MARWFKDQEILGLDSNLVEMLDHARGIAGVPFVITSGRRSVAENATAQGVENSAHLRGLAVDLACPLPGNRFKMVQALLMAGFRRIGVYNLHLHCDTDLSLPAPVMWVGVSH